MEGGGREGTAKGGGERLYIFPSVASSHKRVLLIPGVLSTYLRDEIKTLCELYKTSPAKRSTCFHVLLPVLQSPIKFALKKRLKVEIQTQAPPINPVLFL